jgi:FkbM family methyltransferase
MEITAARSEEAALMYGEVSAYVKHGLKLEPGAVVVDVGANIGIFSLWAYDQCDGQIAVYAFEPIPAIFQHLEANFKHIDHARLKAFNFGLSGAPGVTQFAFYPNATFASTAYPDPAQADRQLTETLLARSLHQLPPALAWIRVLPPLMRQPLIRLLARFINQRQFVTCELQTLSHVIRHQQIERIDFLKIDAEKSELDVLHGIEADDWVKVQQVFAEVHNRDGRLQAIRDLLQHQQFRIIVCEQDPYFVDTDIYAIYARR